MKLIGKGAFTKAYLLDNGRVQLHSCCPFKECMAHGWFPESDLFPKLTFVDVGIYMRWINLQELQNQRGNLMKHLISCIRHYSLFMVIMMQ